MRKLFTITIILSSLLLFGCNRDKNASSTPEVSGDDQSNTNVTAQKDEVVPAANLIIIEKDALNPKNLTVKVGTTVTWVNKDAYGHWIASDPYPSKSDLPALDSKKGLLQSEKYQFKFEKPGKFYYHDELNTNITGVVVVEK